MALFLASVDSTNGEANCVAASVMTTLTSAPAFTSNRTRYIVLYAAMLPVIPTRIFLFVNMGAIIIEIEGFSFHLINH
jgi:hypothetical protein